MQTFQKVYEMHYNGCTGVWKQQTCFSHWLSTHVYECFCHLTGCDLQCDLCGVWPAWPHPHSLPGTGLQVWFPQTGGPGGADRQADRCLLTAVWQHLLQVSNPPVPVKHLRHLINVPHLLQVSNPPEKHLRHLIIVH